MCVCVCVNLVCMYFNRVEVEGQVLFMSSSGLQMKGEGGIAGWESEGKKLYLKLQLLLSL